MKKLTSRTWAAGLVLVAVAPAPLAAVGGSPTRTLDIIVSAVGLGLAVLLLTESLQVRRLATGGAIAERIGLVVLATICLAASALLSWVVIFLPSGVTVEQVGFGARLLVIAAMGLLSAYFFNVRVALQRFLDSMTGVELLDAVETPDASDDEAGSERVGG